MRIALSLALLLAVACDTSYVSSGPPYSGNPCDFQMYQSPSCAGGYDWNPGYYNSYHVWVRPRYIRRSVFATPVYHATIVHPAPYVVNRPMTVYTRPTVTRTTVIHATPLSSPSVSRPTVTVTRRRIR